MLIKCKFRVGGGSLAHRGIYGSQSSICRTWFSPSITCVPETEPRFWALTASTLISALLNQISILMQSTKILGFHSHPCTHSCVCFVRARCHGFSSSFTLRARWFYIPHWILLPTLSTSLREGCCEVQAEILFEVLLFSFIDPIRWTSFHSAIVLPSTSSKTKQSSCCYWRWQ